MARLRHYLELFSVEYLLMGVSTLILGAIFALDRVPSFEMVLPLVSYSLIIFGYNSYNAIIDKEIDLLNKPHRPIPRGLVTEIEAFRVAVLCYLSSIIIAFFVNIYFFVIAIGMILLTILYSHPIIYLKKKPLAGTLSATLLYSLSLILGWAAFQSTAPLLLPAFLFLFLLGLPNAILKDHFDIIGDRHHKAYTIPVLLGVGNSIFVVGLFYVISLFFLIFLILQGIFTFYFMALVPFYFFFFLNLFRLKKNNDLSDSVFNYAMFLLILVELVIASISLLY